MDVLLAQAQGDTLVYSVILALFAVSTLDFFLGTLRAVSNTKGWTEGAKFAWGAFDVWVHKQLFGKVLGIVLTLVISEAIGTITVGDYSVNVILVGGFTAATAYLASTGASILASLNPKAPDLLPTEPPAA